LQTALREITLIGLLHGFASVLLYDWEKQMPTTLSKSAQRHLLMQSLVITQILLARKQSPDNLNRKRYYYDCYGWVKAFVNIKLDPHHEKALLAMRTNNRLAFYAVHGAGKTTLDALIVLWAGAVSDDCKIITTASVWRQLQDYLWPEIHKWYHKTNWTKFGSTPKLLDTRIEFGPNSFATAVSPGQPESIEGAHAQRVVYLMDESKEIEAPIWESAEGAFSTPGDHIQIATSTPGPAAGIFYNICSCKPGYEGWYRQHFSLRDAIRAKRVSLAWARDKRAAWGSTNPVYINRVWGLFAEDSTDMTIPLSWVNAAIRRWYAWQEKGEVLEPLSCIGADTAGQGVDKTCFYKRHGNVLLPAIRYNKSKPMELAGKLVTMVEGDAYINIDTSYGEGSGTAGRLDELEVRCNHINFGEKSDRTDKSGILGFANVRAAMWWSMREQLDPENGSDLCLPDDPLLIGDLTAPKRVMRSDGKILIESKEDIKKRLGRSTDDGDAACLACWHPDVNVPGVYVLE